MSISYRPAGGKTADPPIRALLIEDEPGYYRLIARMLAAAQHPRFVIERAAELAEGLDRLEANSTDVILLDLSLPDSQGLETLMKVYARAPQIPILVLTALDEEASALAAVSMGAQDYLIKGRFSDELLVRSLAYAVERKRNEEALRKSEQKFREIFHASPESKTISRLSDGRLVEVNEEFLRLTGYSREEVIGKTPIELHLWVNPEEWKTNRSEIVSSARVVRNSETRFRLKDGSLRWALISAVMMEVDGEACILSFVRDISDRKQAEEALRESENQLRTIIDSEPECVTAITRDGRVLQMNPAGLTMIEADDPAGVIGGSIYPLVHPDYRQAFEELNQRVFSAASGSLEFEVVGRKGTRRWLEMHAVPLHDQTGQIVAALGIARDVTERKRAGAALTDALRRAEESDRLKGAFLANMSHEIRTPLNVILGYWSLLADHFHDRHDESQDAIFESIRRAGERLMTTIHGVLDISKIQAGAFDLKPAPLPLRSLVERHVEDVRVLARQKGLSLTSAIEEPEATVRFDEYCLSQALLNLLGNAVKFTEEGTITVRLCRAPEGELCLEIRDTGVGIDPGYLPRLFTPFSQELSGYTRPFEGSGLGLALARNYLALNGARISVESEKGRGSTFRVHFSRESEVA